MNRSNMLFFLVFVALLAGSATFLPAQNALGFGSRQVGSSLRTLWPAANGMGAEGGTSMMSSFSEGQTIRAHARLEINPLAFQARKERPKLTSSDILNQSLGGLLGLFLGAFAGLVVGGIVAGTADGPVIPGNWNQGTENMGFLWGAMAGAGLGTGAGVWLAGNTDEYTANLPLVLLGGTVGLAVGMVGAIGTLGILFLGPLAFPIAGAMLVHYLTRKRWKSAENPEVEEPTSKGPEFGLFGSGNFAPTPMSAGNFSTRVNLNLFSIRF
ncbi:MAG: hypothetical protein H6581_01570 [Bacteroidia bacterium]|nr:hypothetical protein [Bacteroidia bacterium]